MKNHNPTALKLLTICSDEELLDELDDLLTEALRGDSRAVGAIAIAFGPCLLQEATKALGTTYAQDNADVLQTFFLGMMERRFWMPRIRRAALPWMKRMVRTLAHDHAAKRDAEWDPAG
jgi:hypothetical protein